MANILVIHIRYPEYDRCSGDQRLTNFLRLLAETHKVTLHLIYQQNQYIDAPENAHYRQLMQSAGIEVESGSLREHLRKHEYDAVIVEFWYVAKPLIQDIRLLQPYARLVVDTEHIYFYSDQWKAKTLGENPNSPELIAKKRDELNVYRRADLVIAVTEEDKRVLLKENSKLEVGVVPNIHDIPDLPTDINARRVANRLIFVGNFSNNPANTDAMIWFCLEVLPLVQKELPDAHLQIVGNKPSDEILSLASPFIEVTGFVPETTPYLLESAVAICPLRYGAGLKGKIGEAMMHGLPVVTTSIGTQGMDPKHGENMMVGDTPQEFAAGIIALLKNDGLRSKVAENGRSYIVDTYSYASVRRKVNELFSHIETIPLRGYSTLEHNLRLSIDKLVQYVRWRLP